MVFPWSFTSSPLVIFTVIVQVDVLIVEHSRAYAHILYAASFLRSACTREIFYRQESKKRKEKQNRCEVRHVSPYSSVTRHHGTVTYTTQAVRHDVGVSELGKGASSDTCIDGRRAPRYFAGSGPGPVVSARALGQCRQSVRWIHPTPTPFLGIEQYKACHFKSVKGLHHSMLLVRSIGAHHTSRQLFSLVGLPLWLKVSEEKEKH